MFSALLLSVLNDAEQFALEFHGHIADLIKDNCPGVGKFEPPHLPGIGYGVCSPFSAEKYACIFMTEVAFVGFSELERPGRTVESEIRMLITAAILLSSSILYAATLIDFEGIGNMSAVLTLFLLEKTSIGITISL